MRTPLVAGNWKMNPPLLEQAIELAGGVAAAVEGLGIATVVCPPAIWLDAVAEALAGTPVAVGAQTMHAADSGAFTGEISPLMLRGRADFCIIGHSERRHYAHETDADVAAKVASAVAHGIRPIAAIGERRDERRAGLTGDVIGRQLRAAISQIARLAGSGIVIAYEPVWAIGTGEAATAADAQAVGALIRRILAETEPEAADETPILYGGSVSAGNAGDFFGQHDIDGALVGGASLDAPEFGAIVRAAALNS